MHLVDLDAAFGRGSNRELLAAIVARLDVNVELSGGIRDDESLAAALATGCTRVNLGTAALEDPEWCARAIADHGDRIAVGLDVRGTTLAARGWTEEGGDLWEVLDRLDADGCARYVVTDVTKDGTLNGPNLDLLREVCERTDRPSWPAAGCRRSTTCTRSRPSCRTASRARSSARRCTRALSRSPRRWRRWRRGATSCDRSAGRAVTGSRRVFSGGPWEDRVGYARAAEAGPWVLVSGCTSVVDGQVQHPGDPYRQLVVALGTAGAALAQLGLSLDDVVRTRMYLLDPADQDEVGRAHRELLGHVRPAATMVVVAGLVHPDMRVEVEVDAYRRGD